LTKKECLSSSARVSIRNPLALVGRLIRLANGSWFASCVANSKLFWCNLEWLSALQIFGFGLVALWFLLPSSVFTRKVTYKPLALPAFYQGGLQKGSGGKLEHNWDSYNPKNLFSPSQAENSSNALLPVTAFPSPESCGSYHTKIQNVWQQSMHAVSATDDWYVRVKETFALERGDAAVRLCAGCHAPVALLTGEVGL
jgi:hypothetical protein